jgi:hypothetical protein
MTKYEIEKKLGWKLPKGDIYRIILSEMDYPKRYRLDIISNAVQFSEIPFKYKKDALKAFNLIAELL